jgi:hypothetical protein
MLPPNQCWNYCPEEEGIKTGSGSRRCRAPVGTTALKKKGLRLLLLVGPPAAAVGTTALKKKGLRHIRSVQTNGPAPVGTTALKKKGLRHAKGRVDLAGQVGTTALKKKGLRLAGGV